MHPIAFHLGPVSIHWYGIFVAIGFLAGLWTAAFRGRAVGLSSETIMDLGIWLIVAGIVGARTFYVIGSWEDFASHPLEIIRVDHGGLVFYGGFIAAVLASIVFVRRRKLEFWKLVDVMAPSVALGHMFGRLGCFMNGCCFGKACALPWAVRFPPGSDAFLSQVNAGQLSAGAPASLAVHPTEIYEAIGNLLIFVGLSIFYPRRKFDGQVFGCYILVYAVLRFGEEFFRGDWEVTFVHGRFTPGHIMAVCMFVVAVGLLWYLSKRRKSA